MVALVVVIAGVEVHTVVVVIIIVKSYCQCHKLKKVKYKFLYNKMNKLTCYLFEYNNNVKNIVTIDNR